MSFTLNRTIQFLPQMEVKKQSWLGRSSLIGLALKGFKGFYSRPFEVLIFLKNPFYGAA
jgi:hypothetical protein